MATGTCCLNGNCPDAYLHCHSDEMRRDQLQVDAMRPRMPSDPVPRSASTEKTAALPLRTFRISRRGKLLHRDTSSFAASKAVLGRSLPRRRAASASACELDARRRARRAGQSSDRSHPSQDFILAMHSAPPSPNPAAFYRVVVAGSSGVGKSTVLTQFLDVAYAGEVASTLQG